MYNVQIPETHWTHPICMKGIQCTVDIKEPWSLKMKRVGMVRVGLYLSDSQMKKLKRISKKKGLTVSEIIRRMIDEGFERSEGGK